MPSSFEGEYGLGKGLSSCLALSRRVGRLADLTKGRLGGLGRGCLGNACMWRLPPSREPKELGEVSPGASLTDGPLRKRGVGAVGVLIKGDAKVGADDWGECGEETELLCCLPG